MKTPVYLLATGTALLCGALYIANAQETTTSKAAKESHGEHVILTPAELQWRAAGPSLPPGAQVAVLEGDPKEPGPFTIRLKAPDGYKVPPHWHPGVEHVTVLSGKFGIAMGEKFEAGKGKELPVGSFTVMPAGMRHFAWVKGETEIQVHGMGPWGITYVNPADDPRNKQ